MPENDPMHTSVDDIDNVLRTAPVFQKLSAEDRRKVAEVAAVRRYKKGEIFTRPDAMV
jgi:hypothetical protein